MKRTISLLLSAALICSLALPAVAAAEESADARLTQVTLKVKNTLGIGDAYDAFYGEYQGNEVTPYWRLNWSGEDAKLNVSAGDDGKIYSYHYSENERYRAGGNFDPAFPKTTQAAAKTAAEAFVKTLLTSGETAAFAAEDSSARPSATQYHFNGNIMLNGLPSPIGFDLTLRAEDGKILRFSREDLYTKYMGGVPSATAKADGVKAGETLKGTLSLKLEYVLDGDKAVLRYLPEDTDAYYVDGQTGALVNLTKLYADLESQRSGTYGGAAEAGPAAKDTALTVAEQAGIQKLEGVLTQAALDSKTRAISGLNLSAYTLAGCTYAVDRETGAVTANLQYGKQSGGVWRRTITVDAKTGALQSISGSTPYNEGYKATITAAAAQSKAEAFLKAMWGEQYGKTALYENHGLSGTSYSFTYAQKENGSFFPHNNFRISVDGTDGSVCRLYRTFDDTVIFDSAEGVITAQAALDAFFATFETPLVYLSVPQKLDLSDQEVRPLISLGYTYVYALKLGYGLEQQDGVIGIDAKTGKPVTQEATPQEAIAYSDMDGSWGKAQVEALAEYGVGFAGGKFEPAKQLTQLDLVALLASTDGYRYTPTEDTAKQGADELYQYAYSRGMLQKADRQDDKLMTRAELVKLLLDGTGYGKAAKLTGIYQSSFADAAAIPAQYYSYAAIAQGLGLVSGDAAGNFAPNRVATRLEAAVMLYNFMEG